MNTKKSHRVTFAPSEDLEGDMCETTESVTERICALFGFAPTAVSMVEGDLDGADLAGTRYYLYTDVRFTVNGIGWSTDFTELVRDTVCDER